MSVVYFRLQNNERLVPFNTRVGYLDKKHTHIRTAKIPTVIDSCDLVLMFFQLWTVICLDSDTNKRKFIKTRDETKYIFEGCFKH